ncbi:Rieske 2Fe-2S domain-containing protein [Halosimplex aquaticum]
MDGRLRPDALRVRRLEVGPPLAQQTRDETPVRGVRRVPSRPRPVGAAPGEAVVADDRDDPVAVYRDEDGEVHAVSAVCTHMGCLVSWNDGEESWDCPCHGSRFDVDGAVLDTPAVDDLDAVDVEYPTDR